ncbi:MAG TPA: NAD(P)H-quinone oxidoreductase [Castellaniella sp.]|uniref:NAD(P)H-quinone oxidoreductase n=1 Tax=Castellaniella sp. TaxID=1955812 RepID=UPI002EE15271
MQAIEITQPGGPEVLQLTQRPKPVPGPGEVLIEVHAAGINRPDVFQRQGSYPPPAGASDLPGLEVAGTIVGGDPSPTGLKQGDSVCALLAGGGYAQYCVAPAVQCLPAPKGLSMVEAAALPETYFTVWSNVFDRGRLNAGETLLVHGGASGIGTTAIMLARAFGHTVYATAGSDERVRAIEAMGCTHGINYHTQDFVAETKALTQGLGVDVILDMVAGKYLERNIQALADDGRLVVIALLGGSKGTLYCNDIMRRRLTVTGSTLRSRPPAFKGHVALALHQHVWPLLEAGTIRPRIHATFPLADAAKAHAMMDSGEQIGKIVLTME